MLTTKAFKAYDVRGVYPSEINEELCYRTGRRFAELFQAKSVVLGHDIRPSGPQLEAALADGLRDAGCDVISIGMCGTEMIYFATYFLKTDGGIMVTASHNPSDYNGMKIVRAGARPVSADTGLKDIAAMVAADEFPHQLVAEKRGNYSTGDIMPDYIKHLLSYTDAAKLKKLKVVVNPGNGAAAPTIDELEKALPYELIKINYEPDGTFPNGVPNPMLDSIRQYTIDAVKEHHADCGVSWDGDFDRCFFCDEKGNFIEGYYLVGLLAQTFLAKDPKAKIMYDPRLVWNTEDIIDQYGGGKVMCKSGHAFMKECMRKNDVVYGGEMSSHHYFRDFTFCDSGMIPFLLVTELLCTTGKKLSELVEEMENKYPCSGEINRKVTNSADILAAIEKKYSDGRITKIDGLSVMYDTWRFNIRLSNTEPVMRLNVEVKGDRGLLAAKTRELLEQIGGEPA